MTQVPANVTIPGLPLGTTTNVGASLIEAVQTAAGQANSVQLTLSQVVSGILGIPVAVASGGTGTTALTAFGVVFGGTSTVGITAAGTTAWPLVGNGSALAPSFAVLSVSGGGINTTTLTQNGVVFGNGTSTIGITGAGNTALVLLSPGLLTSPVFGQVSLTAAVTGILGVPNGGNGVATLTQFGVQYGNGTSAIGITAAGGTSLPLLGQGANNAPSFGVVPLAGGGTATTTLTAHAVLLGEGTSTLGFASVATGGRILIDQGGASDPLFLATNTDLTIGTSGTATVVGLQGRPMLSTAPTTSQIVQWNGTVWLPAAAAVSNVTTGFGLVGGPISTTGQVSIATTNPPYGFDTAVNLQINASTAASALTLSIKGNNGSDPSATNPVLFPFRDSTLANGGPVWRSATAALSVTINQTATIGAASGSPLRGWITAHDTGTTPTIGVINCVVGMPSPTQVVALAQHTLQTTVAISNAAITAGVFYSGVGVNNRPFIILGYFEYANMTTVGQWINTPTQLQLFGPGVRKPGDSFPAQMFFTTTGFSTTNTAFQSTPIAASLAPTSAANLVRVTMCTVLGNTVSAQATKLQIVRGAAAQIGSIVSVNATLAPASYLFIDAPATTSSTTYTAQIAAFNGTANIGTTNGASGSFFQLEEIMG